MNTDPKDSIFIHFDLCNGIAPIKVKNQTGFNAAHAVAVVTGEIMLAIWAVAAFATGSAI